jgi:SWI/SNF-related matrix-associated actin-dependent regulator 1 of chromatin subfamily A
MGLGKTVQAIGLINALAGEAKNVLVVCPASLRINWKRELKKWLTVKIQAAVMSYEQATKFVFFNTGKWNWDLAIFDEAHYLKNPDAKRTQACLDIKAARRVFLSGTPIQNRPIEIWPILHAIDPAAWGSRHAFGLHFCQGHQRQQRVRFKRRDGTMGVKIATVWNYDGASNLPELRERLRSACMVRRTKKEVLKDLPPKIRQIIELPNDAVVPADLLEKMERITEKHVLPINAQTVEELQSGDLGDFDKLASLRHEQALQKVPMVVEHVKDLLESVDKVVIFAHHRDVIFALVEALPEYGTGQLHGGMMDVHKQFAVDAFQNDPGCRVFIGQIQAAGVGITLTAASTVVFAELDWVPGNMSQCEDRCHRIGQKDSVLVQHLVLEKSLDAVLAKALIRKQAIIDQALDAKGK